MDKAESPAVLVIHALQDREGFDGWWDDLDTDIQNEIVDELNETIAARVGQLIRSEG